jgi:hypothetical protein
MVNKGAYDKILYPLKGSVKSHLALKSFYIANLFYINRVFINISTQYFCQFYLHNLWFIIINKP